MLIVTNTEINRHENCNQDDNCQTEELKIIEQHIFSVVVFVPAAVGTSSSRASATTSIDRLKTARFVRHRFVEANRKTGI